MKFKESRKVDKVQVIITTKCNRQCPNCYASARIGNEEASIDKLWWIGGILGNLSEIEISGGEPTLHSEFEKISKNIRDIFFCKNIRLITNGALFAKDGSKMPLILNYNQVHMSHYGEEFKAKYGGKTNTAIVEKVRAFLSKKPTVNNEVRIVHHRGPGDPLPPPEGASSIAVIQFLITMEKYTVAVRPGQ